MKWIVFGGIFGLLCITFLAGFALYTYLYYQPYIYSQEKLINYKDRGIVLLDKNNEPFYFLNNARDDSYVALSQVSHYIPKAIIAAEDRTFYSHNGVSLRGTIRSVLLNIEAGHFAFGGSTLTQQLVKNTLLSPQKSLVRKFQEAVLAVMVESHYSKDQILEMYINSIYFGEGAIGIDNAAHVYFSKDPIDLTAPEAAYLASVLKYPSQLSPFSGDGEIGEKAQREVLKKMTLYGLITEEEFLNASIQGLSFDKGYEDLTNEAPHFALMVIEKLKQEYGADVVYEGLKVTTTLDLSLQEQAQAIVREQIDKNRNNGITNGALVAIDPTNGQVRALVGSANWFDEKSGKVNMATSPRQPGSSFKPIVYSLAMDQGLISPATILRDSPKTYVLDPQCRTRDRGCVYRPQNYDKSYRGPVTVRRALATSLNVPAVEVMSRVGIATLLRMAPEFGITSLKDQAHYGAGLSLALGSAEVSPLEMASAYTTFANFGERPDVEILVEIKNKFGRTIYESKPQYTRVISENTAYLISSILSDNNARSEQFGSTLTMPFPAAVKTGTTENYRDAWTIGYTPSLVVAVWVGNNNANPISNLTGSLAAGPIWKEVMQIHAGTIAREEFEQPDGIVRATYCDSTSSNSSRFEYFVEGTEPRRDCLPRQRRNIDQNDRNLPRIGGGAEQADAESFPLVTDTSENESDETREASN